MWGLPTAYNPDSMEKTTIADSPVAAAYFTTSCLLPPCAYCACSGWLRSPAISRRTINKPPYPKNNTIVNECELKWMKWCTTVFPSLCSEEIVIADNGRVRVERYVQSGLEEIFAAHSLQIFFCQRTWICVWSSGKRQILSNGFTLYAYGVVGYMSACV